MNRVLLIDRDRAFAEAMSLACLDRGIASRLAENLPDGVRYLAHAPVAAIVVDEGLLRLTPGEQQKLFAAVAPDVPVTVLVHENWPLVERVALELSGFHVYTRPSDVEELLEKLEFAETGRRARLRAASRLEAASRG